MCIRDSHVPACECAAGLFCDTAQGAAKCVQCTQTELTNCRGEAEGSACLWNGACGCATDEDCGFDRDRRCNPKTHACIASLGTPATTEPPSSTSPSDSTDTDPAPVPEVPAGSTSKGSSSRSSDDEESDDEESAEDQIPLPSRRKSDSGGCSLGVSAETGVSSPLSFVAMIALALAGRRRTSNHVGRRDRRDRAR